jgi:16S rRNA (guanine966-N2)-methyltransferase
VRGAIFSMLEARGALFSRVLDLFAGTGALGIEAISRGAEWADFVDRDRIACAVIAKNLDRTGFATMARVHCATLPAALGRLQDPYGLIFLDPPYDLPQPESLLERLTAIGLADLDTTIVYEHSRRTMPPEACGPLQRAVTRQHGSTAFTVYEAATNQPAETTADPDKGA